ncbi:MAG TPA: cytochrome c [Kofleriaceae bacterium]|jgi:mono/diheme cytochrome c family protein
MRFVAAALFLVAACTNPTGGSKDGAKVFQSTCATCHGMMGKPEAAMVARMNVRDLTDPEFRKKVSKDLVEKQVRAGSANKLMPSFVGALSDEQIDAVARYVSDPSFVKK